MKLLAPALSAAGSLAASLLCLVVCMCRKVWGDSALCTREHPTFPRFSLPPTNALGFSLRGPHRITAPVAAAPRMRAAGSLRNGGSGGGGAGLRQAVAAAGGEGGESGTGPPGPCPGPAAPRAAL